MPSPVPTVQYRLNSVRLPFLSDRRAISSITLDASSTPVFTHNTGGRVVVAQSLDSPRRTQNALVKAAKIIVVAVSSTNRPVMDARRVAPGWPPPPSPHCPDPGPDGPLTSALVIDLAI